MHSVIFQLSNSPIDKDDYISDESLSIDDFPHMSCIDYIGDALSDSSKQDSKLYFSYCCPKGMFKYDEKEDCIVYSKYPDGYVDEWLSELKNKVSSLTSEDILDGHKLYLIRKYIEKGDSDYIVFHEQNGTPESLQDFIINVIRHHSVGDKFYFGELLDYHY